MAYKLYLDGSNYGFLSNSVPIVDGHIYTITTDFRADANAATYVRIWGDTTAAGNDTRTYSLGTKRYMVLGGTRLGFNCSVSLDSQNKEVWVIDTIADTVSLYVNGSLQGVKASSKDSSAFQYFGINYNSKTAAILISEVSIDVDGVKVVDIDFTAAPPALDAGFVYIPNAGAAGGLLTIQNANAGTIVSTHQDGIAAAFADTDDLLAASINQPSSMSVLATDSEDLLSASLESAGASEISVALEDVADGLMLSVNNDVTISTAITDEQDLLSAEATSSSVIDANFTDDEDYLSLNVKTDTQVTARFSDDDDVTNCFIQSPSILSASFIDNQDALYANIYSGVIVYHTPHENIVSTPNKPTLHAIITHPSSITVENKERIVKI